MPIRCYLAPAAAGKTAYLVNHVRDVARDLDATPRVVLPAHLQVRAWRRRLAESGGAIGVRLLTFDRLYAECLNAAGQAYTELNDPVRYRLIRAIVDGLSLTHYAPLTNRPGFIQVLRDLIGELKAARVRPEDFTRAVAALGDEPRLRELARIYTAYQAQLQAYAWADRAGLGWLALEALAGRTSDVDPGPEPTAVSPEPAEGKEGDWPLLVVDGFANFTPVQLALLGALAGRVGELIITLTGITDESRPRPAHRRFDQTRRQLEATLGVTFEPLPAPGTHQVPALAHLEANLFRGEATRVDGGAAVELIEAPDRAGEVRAALRWLKARLAIDGMRPNQVALLARSISPYRPFILQTAAEFGLPLRLVDGLPLRANPAVAALLDLLRLMRPAAAGDLGPALPRRLVIEAWRSPYFEWAALPEEGATEPIGIAPGDADALDLVARWGRIIGGRSQWEEALEGLAARSQETAENEGTSLPANVPLGPAARALRDKFHRFVRRLTPPPGAHAYRDFVGWLEALIGPDSELQSPRFTAPEEPTALQVIARARGAGQDTVRDRDAAALQALKDVLRGLVWAEEALDTPPVDFPRFLDELMGALEATAYRRPARPGREEILVADVIQARGLPYRALALLGLAEGEFPATLGEDPFLRDADRQHVREAFGLPLEPSTESAEVEFFYETLTRPRERLLLTRPRLADNGAPWQASPFWEEVRRLVNVQPAPLVGESAPGPEQVASWPELMASLAAHPGYEAVRDWIGQEEPDRRDGLDAAATLFQAREDGDPTGPFQGDLSHRAGDFARRFGPGHTWSATRLETYRACPFYFFVGSVLGLEPRAEPAEGLDARQLGSIYHHIFEALYQAPEVSDPTHLGQLLAALDAVARPILDAAPAREGFRETAWWAHTRAEITDNVRRSLEALAEVQADFAPYLHEAAFGLKKRPPLVVHDGDDQFRLRGYIDRVDRAPDGRLRVIDYKTSGPYGFNPKAIIEGKKLQLPLYALAARDALGLGEPADGFYWHIRHAEPSRFTLGDFDGGPQAAMALAVDKAWDAVRGARRGHFVPHPPDGGCPAYCPAAGFCWQYQPGFGR